MRSPPASSTVRLNARAAISPPIWRRNALDIATISCSVVSKVDQQAGVIEDVRITFGVAAPVPYRCTKAEDALKGMKIEESLYEKTAQLIREELNPRDS